MSSTGYIKNLQTYKCQYIWWIYVDSTVKNQHTNLVNMLIVQLMSFLTHIP